MRTKLAGMARSLPQFRGGWLLLSLVCAGAAARSHERLQTFDGARPALLAPKLSAQAQRVLRLNYRGLWADQLYLRAVLAFGDKSQHKRHYPTLAPLLQQAIATDERFVAPYLLTAFSLALPHMDPNLAISLLDRGRQARPDVWRLHFLYGFERFERDGANADSAQAFADAARLSDAPAFMAPLATRMAASADAPELALRMLDAFATTIQDEQTRATLQERRAPLVYQRDLVALQAALRAYQLRFGRLPQDMAVLRETGLLQQQPNAPMDLLDPWGAPYFLDDTGAPTSRNAHLRLRLHTEASKGTL